MTKDANQTESNIEHTTLSEQMNIYITTDVCWKEMSKIERKQNVPTDFNKLYRHSPMLTQEEYERKTNEKKKGFFLTNEWK